MRTQYTPSDKFVFREVSSEYRPEKVNRPPDNRPPGNRPPSSLPGSYGPEVQKETREYRGQDREFFPERANPKVNPAIFDNAEYRNIASLEGYVIYFLRLVGRSSESEIQPLARAFLNGSYEKGFISFPYGYVTPLPIPGLEQQVLGKLAALNNIWTERLLQEPLATRSFKSETALSKALRTDPEAKFELSRLPKEGENEDSDTVKYARQFFEGYLKRKPDITVEEAYTALLFKLAEAKNSSEVEQKVKIELGVDSEFLKQTTFVQLVTSQLELYGRALKGSYDANIAALDNLIKEANTFKPA